LSKCHTYQIVKFCASKKPFFDAELSVGPKKRRNLALEKKRFGVFLMVNDKCLMINY
jgi:hypothetical protein